MPGYNVVYLMGGFAIYAVGALSMILAYRYGELSVLQPINSMSYVFLTILAVLILHEAIPLNKYCRYCAYRKRGNLSFVVVYD